MIKTLSLASVEQIFNRLLRLNPDCLQPISPFTGQVIEMIISPLNIPVFIHLKRDGVVLSAHYQGVVTTKITSSAFALLQQLMSSSKSIHPNVRIEGNVELAQALSQMIKNYPQYYEEMLSYLFGDVLTHAFMRTATKCFTLEKNARESVTGMVKEYIHEEIRSLPGREEVEDLYQDIYELQNDVERFALKVKHFYQQVLNRKE